MRKGASRFRVPVWVVCRGARGDGSALYVMVWNDRESGKRRQQKCESQTARGAEREAQRKEDELEEEAKRPPASKSWKEFREQYESVRVAKLRYAHKWNAVADRFEKFAKKRTHREVLLSDIDTEMWTFFESSMEREVRDGTLSAGSLDSYLNTLRAGFNWARDQRWMESIPRGKRKGEAEPKGRPLTAEEVERMLDVTPKVVGEANAEGYRQLIRGLYYGGMRISEAMDFHWTERKHHYPLNLHGKRPKISFRKTQKNRRFQIVAMAPEFAQFLRGLGETTGFVFNPTGRGRRVGCQQAKNRIREIGKAANVVVEKGDQPQYATAQDLRRTFGTRWSTRVMPPTLQHLMRHASIQTTMTYYVGAKADAVAREIWEEWDQKGHVATESCDKSCDTVWETDESGSPGNAV